MAEITIDISKTFPQISGEINELIKMTEKLSLASHRLNMKLRFDPLFNVSVKNPNEKSPDPPEARKAIIEIERNVVFSALIDSELYMANKEFFEKYSFRSDFLGKIVTVINELSDNKCDLDIISVLEKYIEKYGGTRDDLKRLFAEGMERVPSLVDISSKIALLLMLND